MQLYLQTMPEIQPPHTFVPSPHSLHTFTTVAAFRQVPQPRNPSSGRQPIYLSLHSLLHVISHNFHFCISRPLSLLHKHIQKIHTNYYSMALALHNHQGCWVQYRQCPQLCLAGTCKRLII